MTLQNGLVWRGAVYLWSDTGAWNPETGERVGDVAKIFFGEDWPWAISISGTLDGADPYSFPKRVADRLPANTFDLLEACKDALAIEAAKGRVTRLLVATACKREEASLHLLATDGDAGNRPFEPMEIGAYRCTGAGLPFERKYPLEGMTPPRMRRCIGEQVRFPGQSIFGFPSRFGGGLIEAKVSAKGVEATELQPIGPLLHAA